MSFSVLEILDHTQLIIFLSFILSFTPQLFKKYTIPFLKTRLNTLSNIPRTFQNSQSYDFIFTSIIAKYINPRLASTLSYHQPIFEKNTSHSFPFSLLFYLWLYQYFLFLSLTFLVPLGISLSTWY